MIFFSDEAKNSIEELFKFPYTLGSQLPRYAKDMGCIMETLRSLPICAIGISITQTMPLVGTIRYTSISKNSIAIDNIDWNSTLTSFYGRKSNFITYTSAANIPSVPPSYYKEVFDSTFKCDNDFKVVKRKVRINGKWENVYNFMNPNGKIISKIDFVYVLPFVYRGNEGITARGYTPDRRSYRIYDDGVRVETNESRNVRLKMLIKESVDRCFRKYIDGIY